MIELGGDGGDKGGLGENQLEGNTKHKGEERKRWRPGSSFFQKGDLPNA